MTTSPKLPTDAMVEAGRLALMDEREHDRCISLEPEEMRAALTAALAVAPCADDAFNAGLEMGARVADHAGSWRIATAIRASNRDRAEARAESAIRDRDAAQAALREMREALEPFAAIADWFDSFDRLSPDSDLLAYGDEETHLRVGNFRRARAALAQNKEEGR